MLLLSQPSDDIFSLHVFGVDQFFFFLKATKISNINFHELAKERIKEINL